jgi:hypothetical protein
MRALIAALYLAAGAAPAADPFLGRVVRVEGGSVVVSTLDGSTSLHLPLAAAGAGRSLTPGSLVRIWPGDAQGAGGTATRLEPLGGPLGGGMGRDPSGVRSRLSRGAGMGMGGLRRGR